MNYWHIDVQAERRRSCTYGRAPNAIDIVGFFNVPVQAPTRDQPFYTVIPTHCPLAPVRTPGDTSSVSPACRKRRLKGRRYIAIVADTA